MAIDHTFVLAMHHRRKAIQLVPVYLTMIWMMVRVIAHIIWLVMQISFTIHLLVLRYLCHLGVKKSRFQKLLSMPTNAITRTTTMSSANAPVGMAQTKIRSDGAEWLSDLESVESK